jgi:hypothetical protein
MVTKSQILNSFIEAIRKNMPEDCVLMKFKLRRRYK